jgi:hypothetical protein
METKKLTPEIIALINKPLPKEAIKQHPTKKYLSTIKAIYVVERLNECFGIGGWIVNNEFVERSGAWVVVKSTLIVPEYGITIPDIFGGNDNADLGDAYKGACTDALTKIASYMGIGMDVFKGLADKPADIPNEDSHVTQKISMKELLHPKHKNWNKVVEYLKGTGTMTEVLKKYNITKETETLLINETLK